MADVSTMWKQSDAIKLWNNVTTEWNANIILLLCVKPRISNTHSEDRTVNI